VPQVDITTLGDIVREIEFHSDHRRSTQRRKDAAAAWLLARHFLRQFDTQTLCIQIVDRKPRRTQADQ
jgi:hypothetical protein